MFYRKNVHFLFQWNQGDDAVKATKKFQKEVLKQFKKDREAGKYQYKKCTDKELDAYEEGFHLGINNVSKRIANDKKDQNKSTKDDNVFKKPKDVKKKKK